jgi:hypothetical protein
MAAGYSSRWNRPFAYVLPLMKPHPSLECETMALANRQSVTGVGLFAFAGVVAVLAMLAYFVVYTRPLVPTPVNNASVVPQAPNAVPDSPMPATQKP